MASCYKHILWDWNGTLLDDRELALTVVNDMLQRRKLPTITMEQYLALFDHPVMDFYRTIGLGPEIISASQIAQEFQAGYAAGYQACRLQIGAMPILRQLQRLGLGQSILSASHVAALERSVRHFQVSDYFQSLLGLDNHYAQSKIALGQDWIAAEQLEPQSVLLIGDTTHDFQVAASLGCDCLLVARGHQCKQKLDECGVPVLHDLEELESSTAGSRTAERYFGLNE